MIRVSVRILVSETLISRIRNGTIRRIKVDAHSTGKRNTVATVLEA